jgi:hypothetical protein
VRERVAKKLLEIGFVSSKDQLADEFTNPLSTQQLNHPRHNLKLDKV